jgi:hypothetical protein
MLQIAGYEVDKIKLELIKGNKIVQHVMSLPLEQTYPDRVYS